MNKKYDKMINNDSYPAIYRAADLASINAQNRYLNTVRTYSFLLIIAAAMSVYGLESKIVSIITGLVIVFSIIVSIWLFYKKDEDVWYRARAVAESVKTSTWRFMMRAEPFGDNADVKIVKSQFASRLQNILKEHKDLWHELGSQFSDKEQITQEMCRIRNMNLDERLSFYLRCRIDEQRAWYAKKASYNKRQGERWFGILIFCQIIAITFVILRISMPNWGYWPVEIFVVGAAAVLSWIHVKRFRELTSAYGLTAHELGLIRNEIEKVRSEDDFSQFVIDSESAFSREHTQWLARKDEL